MRISDWSSDVCSSDLGHLRRIGRRLAAALETHGARRRPGNRVALRIGDGDHGVVERGVHVRDARGDVLALAATNALRFACHYRKPFKKRSEEHTSELQSLMRNSYAVFCLKKKKHTYNILSINGIYEI